MRLRQALSGVLSVPVCFPRVLPNQTQGFISTVRPVTNFPLFHVFVHTSSRRSTSSRFCFYIRSPARVSTHSSRSLFPRSKAYPYSSAKKRQPLVLTTIATRCSMTDSGPTVGIGEVVMEESQSEAVVPLVPESTRGSLNESVAAPQDCSTEGGPQSETGSPSFQASASEEQLQATSCSERDGEKEMEVESPVPQDAAADVTDGGDGGSHQQTKSSLHANKADERAEILQMSKRARKKLLRKQKFKDQRKAKRAGNFTNNSNPGFNSDLFTETDYYFENGLRKVYPYHFTFTTNAKERWYGRTLQDIFEREFRVDSPDNFRTSVAKGFMHVNGKVASLDYVIRNGDLIEHHIHRHENPVVGDPIEVVEDNEEVVVINKPPSIPCHPCGKFRFNSIVFIMGKELGYANLRNIYRLDRLTSGVLIMGKTARKTKELENHILHRKVQKEYLARVVGEFSEEEVTVDQPLDCLSYKLTLWRVVDKGGKPSRTTFKRLSYNGKTSLVKCFPHTGRTHQIRVHLQYLGHPIVNDPYYNSPAWGPQRGKGGHCDVPLEELCKRIMQEHNVGLWLEEGENPLFRQRLATQRLTAHPSPLSPHCSSKGSMASPSAGLPPSGADNNTDIAASENIGHDNSPRFSEPATNRNDNTSKGAFEKEEEEKEEEDRPPKTKKARLDISSAASASSSASFSSSSSSLLTTEGMSVETDGMAPAPVAEISSSSHLQALDKDAPASARNPDHQPTGSTEHTAADAAAPLSPLPNQETGVNMTTAGLSSETGAESRDPETGMLLSDVCGEEELRAAGERDCVGVERRGFELERWVPDEHCQSCRLKYVDPKPSEMLLYLHALRYKGPGWDYSTQPPQWAAEDWQEPEDYAKYLH